MTWTKYPNQEEFYYNQLFVRIKKQIVQDYLDDIGGYKALTKKYGFPTKSIIGKLSKSPISLKF